MSIQMKISSLSEKPDAVLAETIIPIRSKDPSRKINQITPVVLPEQKSIRREKLSPPLSENKDKLDQTQKNTENEIRKTLLMGGEKKRGEYTEWSEKKKGGYTEGSEKKRGGYTEESEKKKGGYTEESEKKRGGYTEGSERKKGECAEEDERKKGEYAEGDERKRGEYAEGGERERESTQKGVKGGGALPLFETMLELQNKMNSVIHSNWSTQGYEWYRAIWIECGELMDHYGYKWWKKQEPNLAQVQLEVIDIWHFGLSSILSNHDQAIPQIAEEMSRDLDNYYYQDQDVRKATEALASDVLSTHQFSLRLFWDLLHATGLDLSQLYQQYIGKNMLNIFRQEHGYKEGTYQKHWQGREDNEHLVEILASIDVQSQSFCQDVSEALAQRYQLELSI